MEKRTSEILRVACPILIAEGFPGLSMERVASQMEDAKGTIYNHFPNKEEIVLVLAVESMELRELSPMADPISRTYDARFKLKESALDLTIGTTASILLSNSAQDGLALILNRS